MNVFRAPNDIAECGNWSGDNDMGHTLADTYISDARASGSPCRLNSAIQAMVASQRFGGIEVGFVHALAAEIIRTAD